MTHFNHPLTFQDINDTNGWTDYTITEGEK